MSYESVVLGDSPTFLWLLNEASGTTAADATGNGNTGTYTGGYTLGATGPSGVSATATSFNGSTGFVLENSSGSSPDTFTIECWFKTSSADVALAGFSASGVPDGGGNQDRNLTLNSSGQLDFFVYAGGESDLVTSGAYNDGAWHYVAAVFSATTQAIYVDGTLKASQAGYAPGANYSGYWMAAATGGYPTYLNGTQSAFAIYPVALTSGQVAAHYAATSGGAATALPASGATVRGKRARKGTSAGSRPIPVKAAAPEQVPPVPAGASVRGKAGRRGRSQGSTPIPVASSPPSGNPVLVQVASGAASGTSVTVTLGSPTTPGNTLVLLYGDSADSGNATVSGVTLGGSADNWAQVASQGSNADHAIVAGWADQNCAGGQTSVVISTTGGSGDHLFAWVFEWSGLTGTLDVSSGSANGGVNAWTSGTTGTTAQASEVAFGVTCGACTGTPPPALTGPSSPWVNEAQQTLSGSSHVKVALCGYDILSSTQAVTYNGTAGPANTNDTLVFTLKASASPATPPPLPQPAAAVRGKPGRRGSAKGSPAPLVHLEDVPPVPSGASVKGRRGAKGKAAGSPAPLVHLEDVPRVPSGAAVKGRPGRRGSSAGSKPIPVESNAPEDVQVPASGAAVRGRAGRKGKAAGSPQPLVHLEDVRTAATGAAVRGKPGRKGRAAGSPAAVTYTPPPEDIQVPASGAAVRGRKARKGAAQGSPQPLVHREDIAVPAKGAAVKGRRGSKGAAKGSPAPLVAAFVTPEQGTASVTLALAATAAITNQLAATATITNQLAGSVTIVNDL